MYAMVMAVWMASVAQDKPADKDKVKPAPAARGQLPQNWRRLGLSDDQRQQAQKVRGEYRQKIDALKAQIQKLQGEERKELEKILTESQRQRLREIRSGTGGDK